MSVWELWVVCVLYAITATRLFMSGNWKMGGVFAAYAVAQVFLTFEVS